MKQIILASRSPRRKELLEKIGLNFKVVSSDYIEIFDPKLTPHEIVKKLSFEKAKAVSKNHKNSTIIAADTLVVCNGEILGKPKNKDDAKEMLRFLSGKSHFVVTGFTIINGNEVITKSEVSKVWMKKLDSQEIDDYIVTKEPYGKAGAYAIQERGSVFIQKIQGNFSNAVGLPIFTLAQELKKLGVKVI